MSEEFQRLFMMAEPEILSLNAQAALGAVREPERSQFSQLVRHFLERFFNHETASPDGDAKSRLILIACATGIPGFVVALYLWPVYHQLFGGHPSYWTTVNHHFFFVIYSFVALGMITIFEWDMFFPDLLDIFVLTTLPIPDGRLFRARVAAIAILIGGFLFDANFLAPLVLPAATDPPDMPRLVAGHVLAVLGSGLFSAAFILALQGVLLSVFGERLFRRLSLLLQGLSITGLLMLLFLFPVLSGAVPAFLKSGSGYVLCFPPFWFLGIYQRILEGPAALPIFARLAQIGCFALLIALSIAMLSYPIAYLRRVRRLIEGSGTLDTRVWVARPLDKLLNATLIRLPLRRAVFHFISQTLMRVQHYRIYLVLYGGVGLSIIIATILRLTVLRGQVHTDISSDGVRAAIGIASFWTVVGLRTAFVSPGNQQGCWAFRIVHGRPPQFESAMQQFVAAKIWVFLVSAALTFAACLGFRTVAPPELLTWPATASQALIAAGMCLLLTDLFFMNVRIVAFTGQPAREQTNLALTVFKFFYFIPFAAWLPVVSEPWIQKSVLHFALAAGLIVAAHLALRWRHREIIRLHCSLRELEDDEEEFPMKLGLLGGS